MMTHIPLEQIPYTDIFNNYEVQLKILAERVE